MLKENFNISLTRGEIEETIFLETGISNNVKMFMIVEKMKFDISNLIYKSFGHIQNNSYYVDRYIESFKPLLNEGCTENIIKGILHKYSKYFIARIAIELDLDIPNNMSDLISELITNINLGKNM